MLTIQGQHNIIITHITGKQLEEYYIKTLGCNEDLRQLLMYPYLKQCGVILPVKLNDCKAVEYTDTQILSQGGTPIKQSPVNFNKLFNKLIGRIHGTCKISDKIYNSLGNINCNTIDSVYYCLKRMKMSKYNSSIVYIKYKNNGVPPKLDIIQMIEVKDKFRIVINILEDKHLKLPLMYVMYKLIEMCERKDILENIHLHSQNKLITYDLRWFDVCGVNDWPYKPTIAV